MVFPDFSLPGTALSSSRSSSLGCVFSFLTVPRLLSVRLFPRVVVGHWAGLSVQSAEQEKQQKSDEQTFPWPVHPLLLSHVSPTQLTLKGHGRDALAPVYAGRFGAPCAERLLSAL